VLFCLKQPAVSSETSCTWVAGKIRLYRGLTVHLVMQIIVKEGTLKQSAAVLSNDFDSLSAEALAKQQVRVATHLRTEARSAAEMGLAWDLGGCCVGPWEGL